MSALKKLNSVYFFALIGALAGGAVLTTFHPEANWGLGLLVLTGFLFAAILGLHFLVRPHAEGTPLLWMVAVAFTLRLVVGILLLGGLPVYGNPSDQERAGYVFKDAYNRDLRAQHLATTEKSIFTIFSNRDKTDQYGGYLAMSTFIYRYLSPGTPRTQILLILSAWAGAAAVLFFWLFARKVVGDKTAAWGAWLFCLFPESVLMGASQMREPFLILFVTAACWAVNEWMGNRAGRYLWILGGASLGLLALSPGILFPLYLFLIGWWLIRGNGRKIPGWVYIVVIALAVVALAAFAYGIARPGQLEKFSMGQTILRWFKNAALWDFATNTNSSGRLEFIFASLPKQFQLPFVVVYGMLQPVLPAALLEPSVWIRTTISSLLAAGWYWMLPLLIFATFACFKIEDKTERRSMIWMMALSWVWVLVSSARAGGDMWDNPRYRVIFILWMAVLSAWAWENCRSHSFRWLNRIWLVEAVAILFFAEWYASRYYGLFNRLPFERMLLGIVICSAVILAVGLLDDRFGWSTKLLVMISKKKVKP
jgi:hypothetical protein